VHFYCVVNGDGTANSLKLLHSGKVPQSVPAACRQQSRTKLCRARCC
jgi:hypothetical protein